MSTYQSNVDLLGPGTAIDHGLHAFTSGYQRAKDAFDSLLQYPYLERIKYTNDDDRTGEKVRADDAKASQKKKTLRDLLVDGQYRFQISTERERRAARDLVSYGGMFGTFLEEQSLANFVENFGPIVTSLADTARDNSGIKSNHFKELKSFVDELNKTIQVTTTRLATVTTKLSNATSDLSDINVRETLAKILGVLFQLATSDEDISTQLGVFLGLSAKAISSAFKKLTTDRPALLELVAKLESLSKELKDIGGYLQQLSSALPDMIEADQALSGVFQTVQGNLALLADREGYLTLEELAAIAAMWEQNGKHVKQMLNIIDGVQVARPKAVLAASLFPAYPIKPVALSLHQLANSGERDEMAADRNVVGHPIPTASDTTGPEISIQLRSPILYETYSLALRTSTESTVEELAKRFSPPAGMEASLKNLREHCKTVKEKFRGLLEVEYMDVLVVDNPFRLEPHEEDKINLREMIMRYQALYDTLQDDAVVVIRDLSSYGGLQITILGGLTKTAGEGENSFETYLNINKEYTQNFVHSSANMEKRHREYKAQWELAVESVRKLINEEISNMDVLKSKIIEGGNKKSTFWAVMKIVGGFAMMSMGAFLGGFVAILAGSSAGVPLIMSGVQDLVANKMIDAAIAEARILYKKVEDKIGTLVPILEVMGDISESIAVLHTLFQDIAQNLNDIKFHSNTARLLEIGKDEVIKKWKSTVVMAKSYMDAI